MPRSLNKVLLIGYIADEPTIRDFGPDRKVANLTLVTNDYFRNPETGVNEDIPEWHRLSCWGTNASIVESYVHKGSRLYVEGRIKTRNYTDRDNIKRYVTDIRVDNFILLDSRRDAAGNGNNANNGVQYNGGASNTYQGIDASKTGRNGSYYPQGNKGNNENDYYDNPNPNIAQPQPVIANRVGGNVPSYKSVANDRGNNAALGYVPDQDNADQGITRVNNFDGNGAFMPNPNGAFMSNGAPMPNGAPTPNPVPTLQDNAEGNFTAPQAANKQANNSSSEEEDEIPF